MERQHEPTYLKNAHERLDKWETRVEQLKEEVQETRQLKSAMQRPVEERVEPKLATFRNRLQELKTAGEGDQAYMKERVEEAEAELEAAVDAVAEGYDV